ncbi:MAG: excinuclease ABC subunit UvrC [Candidatus Margulisiibacteriota bacterium]
MSDQLSRLKEKARNFPHQSGVYLFKNLSGRVIYVGKAQDLKKRIAAYFRRRAQDPKTLALQQQAASLDYIVTANELEALFLESNLIKKHHPRYNVVLRDNKQYPYLKLTLPEKWPRLLLVRKVEKDGAQYFGPFEGGVARRTLKIIRRLFPIRTCVSSPLKERKQPCLQYHMQRCLGPCVKAVRHETYLAQCHGIAALLSGQLAPLAQTTRRQMQAAAGRQDFEAAAKLRDVLLTLERLAERQKAVMPGFGDADVFTYAESARGFKALVLKVRQGKLLDKESYRKEMELLEDPAEALRQLLLQYYSDAIDVPAEIIVPFDFAGRVDLGKFISRQKNKKVRFTVPRSGNRLSLLQMAMENLSSLPEPGATHQLPLKALREVLNLEKLPRRIEAFDVSNLQGSNMVAAMVTFVDGLPKKEHYRKFKIRTQKRPNDVGAIFETVYRRFTGSLRHKLPDPDLILIDGGEGQRRAAQRALDESGKGQIPLIALAKRQEEIFCVAAAPSLKMPRNHPALMLLQRIRDEAHRFAVTYHRKKRSLFA